MYSSSAGLQYMSCPEKFRVLGDFWRFHLYEELFPVPLLFIGGNHEPWNFLDMYPQGDELAQNIEFLGRSGIREIGGATIAGISGVYSPQYFESFMNGRVSITQSLSPQICMVCQKECAPVCRHANYGEKLSPDGRS